jgi:aldose 1-epimerase
MMRKFVLALLLVILGSATAQTVVTKAPWGKTAAGEPVDAYTLRDARLTAKIITYGAHLVSVEAPDRNGVKEDVVLGFDDLSGYEALASHYMGATVGRYGNRIARGTFSIGGNIYHLPLNNNGNTLHGGTVGFDRKVWSARAVANGVELTLVSPDGDMGFPGELTVHVRYTLEGDSLRIAYAATTTKATVVNLTNHSYFNLAGNGRGTILNEIVTINADSYIPVDALHIPTGEIAPVAGTPFDFRKPVAVGARMDDANEQLQMANGYDHNYVLNKDAGGRGAQLAARVLDPGSGRTLTVLTTEPGVQFNSGNSLDGSQVGRFGARYVRHAGLCLETQHFPDSPNHPDFPSTVLLPGKTMRSTTVFIFGTKP